MLDKTKEKIPKQQRIGDTCFTSFGTIGGNLSTRNPKNLNNVQKENNNLLSVIIILGTNIHGGEPIVYGGVNIKDIGKIAHAMNYSHGRCLVGSFDKISYEGSIGTGH